MRVVIDKRTCGETKTAKEPREMEKDHLKSKLGLLLLRVTSVVLHGLVHKREVPTRELSITKLSTPVLRDVTSPL